MTNWISVEMANGKVETADRAKVRYASGTVASVSPPSSLRWDTPPCAGVMAGGMCDEMCHCRDEEDERDDGDDDAA